MIRPQPYKYETFLAVFYTHHYIGPPCLRLPSTSPLLMNNWPYSIANSSPDELEDSGWEYGVTLTAKQINSELPQFTRDIQVNGHGSLNLHYVHKKSAVASAIPLLLVNRSSSRRAPGTADFPAFHLVALSLPATDSPKETGPKGLIRIIFIKIGNKLMLALGYDQYGERGPELNEFIAPQITCRMAKLYGGKHVKVWHTNMPIGAPPEPGTAPALTAKEEERLANNVAFFQHGTGYVCQQMTQPQTLGYSLLLPAQRKLLTLCAAGPTASLRVYFEGESRYFETIFTVCHPPTIPLGISRFVNDTVGFPKSWTRVRGNVVFDGEHESGGHFAAYKRPLDIVYDLRKMFAKDGPVFGAVPGTSGYA
ncbi:hypothetical protein B0H19DRAFT_1217280 [Mycena capillaripes]|nr:hypothetical protein B0H19DRAFT_1217280 [Mycena capillaripes]